MLALLELCDWSTADENVSEALPNLVTGDYAYATPAFVKKAYVEKLGQPSADTIFISSWPKSGTNWMCQLVHAIRIRGDPKQVEAENATDLSDIIPYLEADPDVVHEALLKPPVYQVHLKYADVPKGGRIIYVMRDLPDVAKSFWKFLQQFEGFLVNNTVDEVARMMMAGALYYGPWEEHIKSYWDMRDQPHVLLVKYEEMKNDIKSVIAQVAKFMAVQLDDEAMARIEELVSFKWMKNNAWRIRGKEWSERVTGLKVSDDYTLVNDGEKAGSLFTAEMRVAMQKHWTDNATPLFGVSSYDELTLTAPVINSSASFNIEPAQQCLTSTCTMAEW